MSLPSGASLMPGEYKRIQDAIAALEKEHKDGLKPGEQHAEKELSVRVALHYHNEYPKLLYKGQGTEKSVSAANADEEQKYRDQGYGDFVSDHSEEE